MCNGQPIWIFTSCGSYVFKQNLLTWLFQLKYAIFIDMKAKPILLLHWHQILLLGIILQFINNWGLCIPKWGFLLETLYIPKPFFVLLKISYVYQFVFPKDHYHPTLVLNVNLMFETLLKIAKTLTQINIMNLIKIQNLFIITCIIIFFSLFYVNNLYVAINVISNNNYLELVIIDEVELCTIIYQDLFTS